MKKNTCQPRHKVHAILTLLMTVGVTNTALAQNSSLFQRPVRLVSQQGTTATSGEALPSPAGRNGTVDPTVGSLAPQGANYPMNPNFLQGAAPMGANPFGHDNGLLGLQSSWTYVAPAPTRALKIHDIVSIRVEESSTSLAAGNNTSRKTTSYDAVLKDWIRLVGFDTIKPDPQSDGDQRIQTNQSEVYRGDSTQRTTSSMTTNIAAEIVDIRPNGILVLNARQTLQDNDNLFEFSLTGECRSQDINPDNTILSRNILNKNINKQERGHVRDGYSRGWLTKLMARIKPF